MDKPDTVIEIEVTGRHKCSKWFWVTSLTLLWLESWEGLCSVPCRAMTSVQDLIWSQIRWDEVRLDLEVPGDKILPDQFRCSQHETFEIWFIAFLLDPHSMFRIFTNIIIFDWNEIMYRTTRLIDTRGKQRLIYLWSGQLSDIYIYVWGRPIYDRGGNLSKRRKRL